MNILKKYVSEFTDPFIANSSEKKLSPSEMIRSLRICLASEEDAINTYMALADSIDNELVKKTLIEIADEERVHVGEFQELLNILQNDEEDLLNKGSDEVLSKMDHPDSELEPTTQSNIVKESIRKFITKE
jgi:rubrerythrin